MANEKKKKEIAGRMEFRKDIGKKIHPVVKSIAKHARKRNELTSEMLKRVKEYSPEKEYKNRL